MDDTVRLSTHMSRENDDVQKMEVEGYLNHASSGESALLVDGAPEVVQGGAETVSQDQAPIGNRSMGISTDEIQPAVWDPGGSEDSLESTTREGSRFRR